MINAKDIKKGNYIIHKGNPYVINDISIENNEINVALQSLFSDAVLNLTLNPNQGLEEADISRKTASVLFKKRGKLEIMDSHDFTVHKVNAGKEMFETAVEGDQVTYIKFNESVKILELRKN